MPHVDAKPVTRCCVAEGISTQRDVAPFKRVYLCGFHRSLWDAAMAKERERSGVRP